MFTELSRKFGRFVFGRILPKGLPLPIWMGLLRGFRFILGARSGEGGGGAVYFGLVEPEQTRAFVNVMEAGRGWTVFDVGANVGYYTLIASRLVGNEGTVVAFEPSIRNIVYLYSHLQLNKVDNVVIMSVACAGSTSVSIFSTGPNFALGHLKETDGKWDNKSGDTIISSVITDEFVNQTGILPNVIKIDVEGAELQVLHGANGTLSTAKPIVFLSTHSADLRRLCLEYLAEMNYIFEILHQDGADAEFLIKAKSACG